MNIIISILGGSQLVACKTKKKKSLLILIVLTCGIIFVGGGILGAIFFFKTKTRKGLHVVELGSSRVLHLEGEEVFGSCRMQVELPLGLDMDSHQLDRMNFFMSNFGGCVIKNKTTLYISHLIQLTRLQTTPQQPSLDIKKQYWR